MMLTAVTCILVIAAACGPASARQIGGDQHVSTQARQLYQQWEHAALRTSRSLMASGPATSKTGYCPDTRVWLYKDSVCQPEGGKNDSVVISPNTCVSVDLINQAIQGISAYKYSAPPDPKSIQFFKTTDCSGPDKSVGLEGLAGMQSVCPAIKGTMPVAGWSSGSFEPLEAILTNFINFNKDIKSIWYYCSATSSS